MPRSRIGLRWALLAFFLLVTASLSLAARLPDDADRDPGEAGDDDDGIVNPLRAPNAAREGDLRRDDEDERKFGFARNNMEDENNLDLSKEDLKALGLKRDMPKDDDDNGNPNDLASSLKNLGLSDRELAELKKMEDESNGGAEREYDGKDDKRAVEAAPPQGMVAPQKEEKLDLDPNRPPPKPHQPRFDDRPSNEDSAKGQNELRVASAAEKKQNAALAAKIRQLSKELNEARSELKDTKVQLDRSKAMFERSLASQKQEHKIEKEELTAAIIERKRAFDELYEEKQVLGQILEEEQKTLHELQEKIQHPDLGLWIRHRAQRAAILVETPETDAMKYYAKKYMAPKVTKMRHRLALLEKRVEKSVDHLLPAKYGSVVALFLSIGLIGFPVFVTMSTVWSVTKSVSLRQYVLLGNVFLTAFSSGLCIAGLILQQDPLQTLYEASESLFIALQMATAIAFPIFVGVIFFAVLKSRDQEDLFVFGCELIFYVLVGLNYRTRVWRPAMLGENIETSSMMYVVYVIDFLSMTALTISSAKVDRSRTSSFVGDNYEMDVETAQQTGPKVTGVTGTASLASTRTSLSAIGSGLMKAARGGEDTSGKEE